LTLARRLVDGLAATGHYLWGGWGSLASLCLFFALWEFTAQRLGSLILPTPGEAFATLAGLFASGEAWPEIAVTARRALLGYVLALSLGSLLGLLAGLSVTASVMARPIVTLLVGTPPIAWLILALLWFGPATARRCLPFSSPASRSSSSAPCRARARWTASCRRWRRCSACPAG
jgi:NitT/TauT family transport system permease protein